MRGRFGFFRLPLIWRVPLAVSVLMVLVSAVITERVLDRLGSIQETYLQSIANSYLDGVTASISPSVLREDSWEIFDALERLRPVNTAIVPVETIVTTPSGSILAATDPLRYPSLEKMDDQHIEQFPDRQIRIESDDGLAYLERDIVYQDTTIGRIYTIFDARLLLAERRDVLSTLILTNAGLTVLLVLVGFMTVRRMIRPMQTLESHMIEAAEGKATRIGVSPQTSGNSETRRLFMAYNSLLDADEERRELSTRLAEEEKLASLGRLSSVMAHEINNPLGGLLNAVDTLKKHGADAGVRKSSLDLLQRGLQGIGEVVRAALATYRPSRQARPLSLSDFHDAKMLLSPELRSRGQALELLLECEDGFACNCPADPVRQAVINLLLNASAASPDGADLFLWALKREDSLMIEVGDRGPGFPLDSLSLLTGPAPKNLPEGKGLGLWVVRQITDEIGAGLAVEPRPGGGSIVRITLDSDAFVEINHAA
ncbi:MAG: HAMP domain-containing histidine kinase [Alphaproteobacteria bacterium]|nr:HAMP domain-containing histidine kinase [Alphaproteobacteria bacterium]MBU4546685.1 HAMP domain-containing histidine kinase [Alphaproteobacteria bacterium]MBU4550953.1 HAMP domain-containing histidine kinase [Alphaproteobacteria bacterium]MBV1784735.1 HAMP domain-containing histidine kinase [Hoeflea sp.]